MDDKDNTKQSENEGKDQNEGFDRQRNEAKAGSSSDSQSRNTIELEQIKHLIESGFIVKNITFSCSKCDEELDKIGAEKHEVCHGGTGQKRKRSDTTNVDKRKKHADDEQRRRDDLKNRYNQLREVMKMKKCTKIHLLDAAIRKLSIQLPHQRLTESLIKAKDNPSNFTANEDTSDTDHENDSE